MTRTTSVSLPHRLSLFAGDIKIGHTVFALPWAMLSLAVAERAYPKSLTAGKLLLVLACMVTARTVAMSANRLLDASLDSQNPRTRRRAIPSGALSVRFYLSMLLLCAAIFIAAAAGFLRYRNPLPLLLSVPVLAFVSAYPLLKRFTRWCHYYLGAALALAPICAWVAITGTINLPPLIMGLAVITWTAGFDIIYACQDCQSDLATGTFSIPSRLGIPLALWVARFTHLLSIAMMVLVGRVSPGLGPLYVVGVAIAVVLLLIEHSLVKPNDLSKVNVAFFTMNGIISVALATLGILDTVMRR